MRRAVKWLSRAVMGAVVIVLLAVIAIAFILNTQTGARWAIDRVNASIPADISIDSFDGTFWAGLHIPLFVYRDSGREIRAVNVDLDIDWSSVLATRIILNEVGADAVEYQNLTTTESPPGPFELAMAPLPVTLGVVRGRISTITLAGSGDPIEIRDLLLDEAILADNVLDAKTISAGFQTVELSIADLQAELDGDVPLSLSLAWSLVDNSWSGSGSFRGSLASLNFDHAVSGDYPATLAGELKLLNRIQPEIDARVRWDQWSFSGYVLNDGTVDVRGTIDEYAANYDVATQVPGGEILQLSGTATGNTRQLFAFDADVSNPAGNANLVGSLAWQPEFVAEAQVRASDFNPAIFVEEIAGSLDADAHVRIFGAGNLDISNANITGVLNDATVNASGNVAITAEQINCEECLVAVGDNRISINGTSRGDRLALTLSVDAPSLDLLWPGIGGRLSGQGQLGGSRTLPQFSGDLHGQNLRFADWSAEDVVVVSLESTPDAVDLGATVQSLRNGDREFGTLALAGKGAPEMLDLEIDWALGDLEISAAGNVQQRDDLLNGVVTRARLTEANTGSWSLSGQPEFQYSGGDLSFDAHAWSSDNGQLRVSQITRVQDELTLIANLVDFPLPMANSFLPVNLQLQGAASADIDVVQKSGLWGGSVSWRQADTMLTVLEADGQSTIVSIPRAELDIELKDAGAVMTAVMTIEPGVTAELDLAISEFGGDAPIVAEMRLQGSEWDWVPALVPTVDQFKGAISAVVRASGPLTAPEFSGDLNWKTGSLVVPALNVPVTDIDLTVSGTSAGAATVSGSAQAGAGDLNITGRFEELTQPTRSVRLTLNGDSAELVNWPEYHLWASPDLVVTGTSSGWTVSGALEVPRADVVIVELPEEAVKLSADVTVIGREQADQAPVRVSGDARLVLGERVKIEAFGLETGLQGELQIKLANDRPISATGKVSLVGGTFSAYGQKLTIQRGTLTFTGPLDNPLVDVRAVRVVETFDGEVTAGIHLQGRAQSINSNVFSEPSMSEADTLSYLVVGRPLSQATAAEGNELSSAAFALGVKQATRITDQIGQVLGLDQLSVAGNGGDTTALVAGKQVNSRLHARYAYGVFSRLGSLLLRYKLSRRLTLEAEAGETQSINLLYSVEKQ